MPAGYLSITAENLVYLDINDDYIHQLFPLLQNNLITKPDYFGENLIGAHISVIYPEENKLVREECLNKKHYFNIKDLYVATLNCKKYYVITVASHTLLQLREKYGLPEMLCFKGHMIEFHITIGIAIEGGSLS